MISTANLGTMRIKHKLQRKKEQTKQLVVGICVIPLFEGDEFKQAIESVYLNVRCVDFTTLMKVTPKKLDVLVVCTTWIEYYCYDSLEKAKTLFPDLVPILMSEPVGSDADNRFRRLFPKTITIPCSEPLESLAIKYKEILDAI
jgi:hypothetical protein